MASKIGILHGKDIDGIEVMVKTSETHSLASRIASNPLEDGNSLSEHVALLPNAVEIVFEMTNAGDGTKRAKEAFQQFAALRDKRQLVDLETEHARYKNMVVTSFEPTHKAPFKGAYSATIRLEQVGIVGVSDMVTAAGGRPESVLAEDGTNKTAVSPSVSGEKQPIKDKAKMAKCLATLATYGVGRFA